MNTITGRADAPAVQGQGITGAIERTGRPQLYPKISTINTSPHSPARRSPRCPGCGAGPGRLDPFAGRFGDSARRCAACGRRSERRDWLGAA